MAITHRPLSPSETVYLLFDFVGNVNFVIAAEIRGLLSLTRVADSMKLLRRFHPMLNTRIVYRDGWPWFIKGSGPVVIDQIPKNTAQEDHISEEMQRTFDVENGPLVRASLQVHSKNLHTLFLTFHHSCSDGRSAIQVMSDLLELCRERTLERTPLADLPLPMEFLLPPRAKGIQGIFTFIRALGRSAYKKMFLGITDFSDQHGTLKVENLCFAISPFGQCCFCCASITFMGRLVCSFSYLSDALEHEIAHIIIQCVRSDLENLAQ